MSAEEFVARLADRPPHTEYAIFLGAGCSVASGIPAAGTLVADIWLPRLYDYRGKRTGASFEEWVADVFPGYSSERPALSYGPVMEALFPSKHDKQREVERICRAHDPGFGCCVLAKLIEREAPDFNVVLTTNFDDLLADALYLFTASRPLVIPHAALASFMRPDFERPLVAKLHGDHQLEPLNTREELAALNEAVRTRLQSLLQQRGLVVMGYAGNDESIMDALEQLPTEDSLGPGIWWVARSAPNQRVQRWLAERKGHWVESADFDQLMLLCQQHFDLPHPEIDRWKKVHDRYFEAFGRLRATVEEMSQSEPSASALKQASTEALERIPDWWNFELRARPLKTTDPDAADVIYREGIQRLPSSLELLGSYAVFLDIVRRDPDAAETYYRRAIDIDPHNANNLGNYALFLHNVRKAPDAAETYYRRAIDADPDNANNLGNYALFLKNMRRDPDAAETYYRRAIDADPEAPNKLGNYALFLHSIRRHPDAAETYYRRAIDIDPDNANTLGNYAQFLISTGRAQDAREYIDRAFSHADDQEPLLAELWFYRCANGAPEQRGAALSELKRLLTAGVRSDGWDFSENIARAVETRHAEADWLPRLAAVIADEAPIESLAGWTAWQDA